MLKHGENQQGTGALLAFVKMALCEECQALPLGVPYRACRVYRGSSEGEKS